MLKLTSEKIRDFLPLNNIYMRQRNKTLLSVYLKFPRMSACACGSRGESQTQRCICVREVREHAVSPTSVASR